LLAEAELKAKAAQAKAERRAREAEERLNAGLASLPPGRTLRWWLGLPDEV